jgi:hypothetical protein
MHGITYTARLRNTFPLSMHGICGAIMRLRHGTACAFAVGRIRHARCMQSGGVASVGSLCNLLVL